MTTCCDEEIVMGPRDSRSRLYVPHFKLMLSTLGGVAAMANVSSEIDRQTASDAAWLGRQRLGFAQHLATLPNDILSFPAHADYWSRAKELNKAREKGLLAQVSVVLFCHFRGRPNHFQSNKLVPAFLKTSNDVTH